MERYKFINEIAKINYFKRWSMLNVKILLVEHSIKNSEAEQNTKILRAYRNTLLNNKHNEKKLLTQ